MPSLPLYVIGVMEAAKLHPELVERAGVPKQALEGYDSRQGKEGLLKMKRPPRSFAEALYPHLVKDEADGNV